ncbi:hypothetical protein J2Y45_001602 [Dyadobacter sp. BE34]|uniref:FecR protein domain-containing protein n=1 Tax=Dyadobacter fermentans TaxID=94254 RepID=A0ABU1QT54_9BACT|nr:MULTISPECIES: hypothetical protein [Dyadobacter]MDR6804333.1 hypothetical protein [Dyadobacter fermentans]MDR7042073.1 hypothetical protein [Dyadobacter sp. BE242]MDR7196476.1 hypothetical protein [Dyadobacter sp. BE34]MDR7212979.1 hypothetical protein [Dyadobacter sp. BE31]MDR7261882.1 hypothetical protein [Dyadobacter sp. BE32]
MKISKELIEKYHHGHCTDKEKAAVEDWLLNDDTDETMEWPSPEEKTALQSEMWNEIAAILPASAETPAPKAERTIMRSLWKPAIAACLLAVLGSVAYSLKQEPAPQKVISLNNSSGTENKALHEKEFTLSIAPKSNVAINSKTGIMDFCGAVLINPKEDIELTFQGTCANPAQNREKVSLKKGQNYIALNYGGNAQTGEVIVVEEGAMASLPPLVLKQLMHQFNI